MQHFYIIGYLLLTYLSVSYGFYSSMKRVGISGIRLERNKLWMIPRNDFQETSPMKKTTIPSIKRNLQKLCLPPKLIVALVTFFSLRLPTFAKPAKSKFHGWDLFGRVPYDDFLFTTSRLTDPNLFRQSIVEAVTNEIPIAYSNYKRRMIIGEIFKGARNTVLVAAVLAILFLFLKLRPTQVDKLKDRFTQLRGFDTPLSAKLKDKNKKKK